VHLAQALFHRQVGKSTQSAGFLKIDQLNRSWFGQALQPVRSRGAKSAQTVK
jgi:hypothetical protein